MSMGCNRLPSSDKFSSQRAIRCITRRSSRITRSMPGRITLTTTDSPVCNTAAWTCATEAEASGSASNVLNRLSMVSSRLCSMMLIASLEGKEGTWSCSFSSSSEVSGSNKSLRVESIWPNLTKIGPSCSRERRKELAGDSFGAGNILSNSRTIRTRSGVRSFFTTNLSSRLRVITPRILSIRKNRIGQGLAFSNIFLPVWIATMPFSRLWYLQLT